MKHLTAAAAVAWLGLVAWPADATLIIATDVGGTTFNCQDNAGCDLNPAVGTLQIGVQTINGVTFAGSIQEQTIGTTNILNTSSLTIKNNNAFDVNIAFAVGATDFTGPIETFDVSGSGTWQQAIGSSITMQWFNDPNNQQGAETVNDTPGALLHSFSDTATLLTDAFATVSSGAANDPNLFSMTETASGLLTAGGSLVNRGQTSVKEQAIPEPASLMILGTMLAGLGMVGLRRRQKD